ncbi:MAG: ATP-binding protein [Chloroflexota bacterium]|nr:ATP-binding protein [Chloroflexota bacterium]
MHPAPAIPRPAKEHAPRSTRRDIWAALVTLAITVQVGLFLVRYLPEQRWAAIALPIAVSAAPVAVFAGLMLFRMTLQPMAIFAAGAVVIDALALLLDANAPILLWAYPTILLAGGCYALVSRWPIPNYVRRTLPTVAASLSLFGVVGVLQGALFLAGQPSWTERYGIHLGLVLTQVLAIAVLLGLYRASMSRLAGWLLLSLMPSVIAGLLIYWFGESAETAVLVLRGVMYTVAGAGAWVASREFLFRASHGQLAMGLAEQIRDTVTGSVDPQVMSQRVAGVLCRELDLDELVVLLRTPQGKGLEVAAVQISNRDRTTARVETLSEDFRASVLQYQSAGAVPPRPQHVARDQMVLPLTTRDQELGLVLAKRQSLLGLSGQELQFLEIALGQFALGISNAQLLWESQSRLNRAEALRSLAVETSGNVSVAELARLLLRHAQRLTGAQHAELFLRSDSNKWMRYVAGGESPEAITLRGRLYDPVLRTKRVNVLAADGTSIAAPLISGGNVVGVLAVHSHVPRSQVTEEDEVALVALADQAVISLERGRLSERVARQSAETDVLYAISKDVSFVLGLSEGVQRVVERSAQVLGCELAAILLSEEGVPHTLPAVAGARGRGLTAGENLSLLKFRVPVEPLLIPDVSLDTQLGGLGRKLEMEGVVSALAVPLQANGQDLGVLLAGERRQRTWMPHEVLLAQRISRQTAIALENGRLLRSEQDTVAKLRQLDSIKSNVIRSASHELRTPLVSIKGYSELLLETTQDALKPRQLRQLQTIAQQTDRVLRIIDNTITISALEDGGLAMEPRPCEIASLVETSVQSVQTDAKTRDVSLSVQIPEPGLRVMADPMGIEKVLISLLDNALKFAPKGSEIRVTAVRRNTQVRVTVQDCGPGVAETDREHIFEKFHRGSTTVDDAVPGTGLGLAIAKGIVEAHNGELGLDCPSTGGAAFWFTLPAAP